MKRSRELERQVMYDRQITLDRQAMLERAELWERKMGTKSNVRQECVCVMSVCICDNPKYELVKLSNNLYCVGCNKWKCRCEVTLPFNRGDPVIENDALRH